MYTPPAADALNALLLLVDGDAVDALQKTLVAPPPATDRHDNDHSHGDVRDDDSNTEPPGHDSVAEPDTTSEKETDKDKEKQGSTDSKPKDAKGGSPATSAVATSSSPSRVVDKTLEYHTAATPRTKQTSSPTPSHKHAHRASHKASDAKQVTVEGDAGGREKAAGRSGEKSPETVQAPVAGLAPFPTRRTARKKLLHYPGKPTSAGSSTASVATTPQSRPVQTPPSSPASPSSTSNAYVGRDGHQLSKRRRASDSTTTNNHSASSTTTTATAATTAAADAYDFDAEERQQPRSTETTPRGRRRTLLRGGRSRVKAKSSDLFSSKQ